MAIEKHITISEAAEQFGVSRQRMHQLIETYGVPVVEINSRMKMVKIRDLKRIPDDRPPGPRSSRK